MATLPNDITTGIIRIGLRTVELLAGVPDVDPVAGSVTFTPTPKFLRSQSNGMIFPTTPIVVYLDELGDANVTLIATDATNITPTDWTYEVKFDLDNAEIASFHIDCPAGSDRELTSIAPFQASDGIYYALGASGGDAAYFVVSDTTPTETTHEGVPVVWVRPTGTLADVPATPTEPAWDIINRTVTVPNLVGVQYYLDAVPITPGVETPIVGTGTVMVTVTTAALPGYVLPGTYTWPKQFVDFTASTLYASDGFSGAIETIMPSTQITGRTLDMALGGNGGTLTFERRGIGSLGYSDLWKTSGGGKAEFKRLSTGGSNDSFCFNTGSKNFYVEFDFEQFHIQHGDFFTLRMNSKWDGASFTHPIGAWGLWYDAGGATWKIRKPDSSDVAIGNGGTDTSNPMIGHWRISSYGQITTIEAPSLSTWSHDFTATADSAVGTYFYINFYSNNTNNGDPKHIIDNLEVGRWV